MILRSVYIIVLMCLLTVVAYAQQETPAIEPLKVDVVAILDKVKNPFKSLIAKPEPAVPVAPRFDNVNNPNVLNEGINKVGQAVNRAVERSVDMTTAVPKPVKTEEKIPNVSIEGIIWSDTIHQAIINGEVVGIGDKVSDMTIQDINAKGIIVEFHGKQYSIAID